MTTNDASLGSGAVYLDFRRMKTYVAPNGAEWRRRGDRELTGKDLSRRVRDSRVAVTHHYLGQLCDVPVDERDEFWAGAELRMAESGYADFKGFEFRSETGELLLVVDETY